MGYILGGALLFGATGLVLKSFVRKKVVGDDDRFDMVWRDRIAAIAIGIVRRLHRRPDLGRQRHVLRR